MLNDLRMFTRLSIFFQILPTGFLVALPVMTMLFDDSPRGMLRALPWLLGLAIMAIVAWAVGVVTWSRRANTTTQQQTQDGTLELINHAVRPQAIVPGRVTLTRPSTGYQTGMLGGAQSTVPAGHQAVLTVLPPDSRPRRLCVLVPVAVPVQVFAKGSVHQIALHPTRPEVGVLIDAPVDQAALAQDPRWTSSDLPTNNSVVGGYVWLVPIALAGMATGALLGIGLAALFV